MIHIYSCVVIDIIVIIVIPDHAINVPISLLMTLFFSICIALYSYIAWAGMAVCDSLIQKIVLVQYYARFHVLCFKHDNNSSGWARYFCEVFPMNNIRTDDDTFSAKITWKGDGGGQICHPPPAVSRCLSLQNVWHWNFWNNLLEILLIWPLWWNDSYATYKFAFSMSQKLVECLYFIYSYIRNEKVHMLWCSASCHAMPFW